MPKRYEFTEARWQQIEDLCPAKLETGAVRPRITGPEDRRRASGKRQIIEGVSCQLKDFFGLERHRTKPSAGC